MSFCLSPIPVSKFSSNTQDYRLVPVDHSHPESQERLVRVSERGVISESFYAKIDGSNWPYGEMIQGSLPDVWARKGVVERLLIVNRILHPFNAEICVLDGYRPIACQEGLWDFFSKKISQEHSYLTEHQKREHVTRYVSEPTSFSPLDYRTWPTHSTGGAVDVTLRQKDTGNFFDMGARFDEMSDISHTLAFEVKLALSEVCAMDARVLNRRLLYWAMTSAGFTNYSNEYWHFDYGNQMHIHTLKQSGEPKKVSFAWYGYIPPP